MNTKQERSFTTSIESDKTPTKVFNYLLDVSKWWSKDFAGHSAKLNDEFIIHHPGRHYSKQKLVDVVPGKKLTWLVTESKLDWLEKDKDEWTNTRMVFEISTRNDKTILAFRHDGLTPDKECYAMCERGWNMVITERLFNFITSGITI